MPTFYNVRVNSTLRWKMCPLPIWHSEKWVQALVIVCRLLRYLIYRNSRKRWRQSRLHNKVDIIDTRVNLLTKSCRCWASQVYRGKGEQILNGCRPRFWRDVKAEQERQAAVIRAEGEAQAAMTISLALEKAGEAFLALRKIEASKAIAQSLSMNGNVTYIPGGGSGNVLLNIPAPK